MSFGDESYTGVGREESSRSGCLIVGLVLVGILAVVLVCCGGCGGLGYWGMTMIANEVREDLRDNPVIEEQIGEIQSFEMDMWASLSQGREDVYVFHVQGPKGSGTITAECYPDELDVYHVESGELRLDSGETYELVPEEP